jgi:HD-GYP domain-containing protein (c-di-GMP phosphodiesterase class II)
VASFEQDAHAPLPFGRYADTVRGFVEAIYENTTAAVMIQSMAEGDERLSRHASDVCFLSLLLGMRLEHYLISERQRVSGRRAKSIVGIGVAAMVADVGILELPPTDLRAWADQGSDERDPVWRRHVALGHARVRQGIGPAPAAAVLHHHQRFDGSGFPDVAMAREEARPLRGREIHVFARIVGAADLYQRLKRPMHATTNTPTVRVLRALTMGPESAWIDPVVRDAMLAVVPAFAPGSVVRLSTGDRAVVVAWDPASPCRPTVRIVPERLDRVRPAEIEIDLRRQRSISVVEAEGVDVSCDLFDPREAQSAASDASVAA